MPNAFIVSLCEKHLGSFNWHTIPSLWLDTFSELLHYWANQSLLLDDWSALGNLSLREIPNALLESNTI